jgi:predicted Zn finger-like uncharacterized protein
MRFVCESCQTRYVISDERAQGRTLKVRCKKCGQIIVVKPEGPQRAGEPETEPSIGLTSTRDSFKQRDLDDEATQTAETGSLARREDLTGKAAPSGVGEGAEVPAWHVISTGQQLGPLPLSALIEKMIAGEMTARAYVWRDGLMGWKRAEEVPEVARWLPARRPSTPPLPTGNSRPPSQIPIRAETPTRGQTPGQTPQPRVSSAPPRAGPSDEKAVERFFEGAEASTIPAPARVTSDPMLRVRDTRDLSQPKPGELTKFFMTRAGVTRRRSPWTIAAFVLGGLVVLVGCLLGLAQLGVSVPLLTPGDGPRAKVFTGAEGDAQLRDLLTGKPKGPGRPTSPGAHPAVQGQGGQSSPQGPLARKAEQHVDQLAQTDKDQLARLYAKQDLSNLKIKPSSSSAPVVDRTDVPLTPDQVSRTVAKFQTGYTRCIDAELKRNPNFRGGKIRIVTTIMSSGLVRQAQIESDDARLQRSVAAGALGTCLADQTRRMVFPSFQGEPFDAEIPLVLSSSM